MNKRHGSEHRASSAPSGSHYSYTIYADKEMARSFEERRFGGPIGELVASTQARVLANMVGRIKDRPILDVATGTGRAALLMARGGADEIGRASWRERVENQYVAVTPQQTRQ